MHRPISQCGNKSKMQVLQYAQRFFFKRFGSLVISFLESSGAFVSRNGCMNFQHRKTDYEKRNGMVVYIITNDQIGGSLGSSGSIQSENL